MDPYGCEARFTRVVGVKQAGLSWLNRLKRLRNSLVK